MLYKACQKKALPNINHTQRYLHSHFLQENHNGLITDCDIVIIDKTDPAEPTVRENYWINRLRAMYPLGLNVNNESINV